MPFQPFSVTNIIKHFSYSFDQEIRTMNQHSYDGFVIDQNILLSSRGAIFLHWFRLYMLSFMFRFMFVNICLEKNQNSQFQPLQVWYVMIHVIKHDMDPNSSINYCRKIPPISLYHNFSRYTISKQKIVVCMQLPIILRL